MDNELIPTILELSESWQPTLSKDLNPVLASFIKRLLNPAYITRLDKMTFINDEFINKNFMSIEKEEINMLMRRNVQKIYKIYAEE